MRSLRALALLLCFIRILAFAQSPLDLQIDRYSCSGSLDLCLKQIESQSALHFSYKQELIHQIQNHLELEKVSIRFLLDTLCAMHDLSYELLQGNIVVIRANNPPVRRLIVGVVLTNDGAEVIPDALVYMPNIPQMVFTDKNGMFRVWVEADSTRIIINKKGYQDVDEMLIFDKEDIYVFRVDEIPSLQPVIVHPKESEQPRFNSRPYIELNPGELRIPSFGGEQDAMMNVKMQSGIQNVGLGDPGLIVRGGGPDQNFTLIDGIPVYNTFHMLGLYSIFNSSTINGVKLYKDAFPSRYGSRLSSVVDVSLNNGNKQRFSGDADIGIISSGISLNGPIFKNKLSFSIAARRTYADLITFPIQRFLNQNEYQRNTTRVWYYDVFAKFHYQVNPKSQFKITLYNGGDQLDFNTELDLTGGIQENTRGDLNWRNNLAGFQWNYIWNKSLFMTFQSAYSSYDVSFEDEYNFSDGRLYQKNQASTKTGLSEFRNTLDFDLFSGKSNHILFGVGIVNYTFKPFEQAYSSRTNLQTSDTIVNSTTYLSREYYAYLESNVYLENGLFSLGMRVTGFQTTSRKYLIVQPRIFLTKNITRNYQFRFSITDIGQFLHLIPNNNLGLPIDIWLPVTDEIEPLRSFQISTGFKGLLFKNEFDIGLFAKNYRNLIEHQEGANFLLNSDNWISNLNIGAGSSFGFECSTNYEGDKFRILTAYTYCRSVRNFTEINGGNSFYSKYDRPHTIRFFGQYFFNRNKSLNVSFTFASGNPVTIPSARYVTIIGGQQVVVEEFDKINNFRLPPTHHLDLSYETRKHHKRINTTFVIGIYNIYNQLNPFMVYIGLNEFGESVLKLRSYLPMMPMIKYHIEF